MNRPALLGLLPRTTSLFLLPLGAGLGPDALGLLSERVLEYLDPAVPVVLAALGVIVGLGLSVPRPTPRGARIFAAVSLEELFTGCLVGVGVYYALTFVPSFAPSASWFVAAAIGICAAMSTRHAPVPADNEEDGGLALSLRPLGLFDNALPIACGCVALALIREPSLPRALWLTLQVGAVALLIALAGWLLIARGATEREQRIFLVGSVFLLGGSAEYVSLSSLFAGLLAGIAWGFSGGAATERIRQDILHVRHPLLVFVLIVAGARAGFSPALIAVSLAYVVLRVVGKVAGWRLARVIEPAGDPASKADDLAVLAPGIIGVAFALNVLRVAGPDGAAILAIAAAGSFGSELVWLLIGRPENQS